MNEQKLRDSVLAVLQDVAPDMDVATVDPDANFRDQFDFDSMDFLNFAIGLNAKFGVEIPETDYPKLSNLSGCETYPARQARHSCPIVAALFSRI